MAVISLVIEAMGTTASASFAISTLPLASSNTSMCFALTGKASMPAAASARVAPLTAGLPCVCSSKVAQASNKAGTASFQPAVSSPGAIRRSIRVSKAPPRADISKPVCCGAAVCKDKACSAVASCCGSCSACAARASATCSRSARMRADSHQTTG